MEKTNRQYFTRKNFIAFSLVALFSILLIFVALCIDRSDMAIVSAKNPFAQLADSMKFKQITSGIYGLTCVALVAIYAIIFTVAVVFEGRLAYINKKPRFSAKMCLIYAVTLVVCAVLSLGLGLIIQPSLTAENILNHLIFLGESLAITLIVYVILALVIGAVVMLVVNFLKVGRPFEFFNDTTVEEIMAEDETTSVASNFDNAEQTAVTNSGAASSETLGIGVGVSGGGTLSSVTGELEDREIVFPALSTIDSDYEGYTAEKLDSDDVSLKELCEGFRNYLAKHEKLYYDIGTIRMFISGMNATRLLLLEGLSGTGKSSLPRYFSKYVNGKSIFLPVQATWRDRTNLLGYFNDFSKTYAETDFLRALYEANYDEDRINMFVLDELNISRVEYYFADFLSVLEYPEEEWKLRIMHLPVGFLPPVKLEEGYIKIPANSYFVGTANKDDSTFAIADKVYDRAITIDFDNRNEPFEPEGDSEPITLGKSKLDLLFAEAEAITENAFTAEDIAKLSKVTDFIYNEFDVAFGNRVLNQISVLVPTYIACGGAKEEVLDFILARKVLVKLEGRFEDYIKDSLKQLLLILDNVYGSGTFAICEKAIENLIKKL